MRHATIDFTPAGADNDLRFHFEIDDRLRNTVTLEFRAYPNTSCALRWTIEHSHNLVVVLGTDAEGYIDTPAKMIAEMFAADGPTLSKHGMVVRVECLDDGTGIVTQMGCRCVEGV